MDNFIQLLESIKTRALRISQTKTGETIQQADRNKLKAELVETLGKCLAELYPYTYRSKDGILLEIANDCVADGITNENGSGAITIAIDIKVMSLETNAETEFECYNEHLAEKAEKEKAKAEAKAAKIARDTANRQKKG